MARFCKECGAEIPEGVSFCNACGAPVQQQSVQTQPAVSGQPVQQPKAQPVPLMDGTVGTGYFFGMMLVYAIPIIGWIACILTALKGKQQTKKNFAKAMMIWLIIGLILSL
ncbi:MAG: zinc-ribbon domain-containing protein, partial [Firmicutes bacterium]|nr:zinc-ribbon domain-containing protein [Bacillota bacterium]